MNGLRPRSSMGLTPRSLGLTPRGQKEVSREAAPLFASVRRALGSSPDGIPPAGRYEQLAGVYGRSAWIFAATSRRAQDEAAVPVRVLRRRAGALSDVEEQHPLRQLLRRVNDFTTLPDLIELDALYQMLTGNSYWLFFGPERGLPQEVWPIPPHWVKVVPDPAEFVAGYVVRAGGTGDPHPFLPINRTPGGTGVLHLKRANPANVHYGQGCLQAAWGAALTDEAATEYRYMFYKNSARPDGLLSTDKKLTDAGVDQLRDWWRQAFQGPANAHRVAVLDSSLKYQAIAVSPKDMDLVNDRRLSREDILVAFGVSLAVLGIETGDVGRRDEQIKQYYQSTIKPACLRRAATLTEFLGPRYGADIEIAPDFSRVMPLQEDELYRVQIDATQLDRGVVTINEVRARLGRAPVSWGDRPLDRYNLYGGLGTGTES